MKTRYVKRKLTAAGSRESGNITVELAMLLPVMAIVLSLILHFSLYLYYQNQLDNSAHRLLKLLVFEQSVNKAFNGTESLDVMRELKASYPQLAGALGVQFAIVSDVSARNLRSPAEGQACHNEALINTINDISVVRPGTVQPRNIAMLSVCLNLSERLPLSAFAASEWLEGLGNIQRTSYYPVSPNAFR